MSVKFKIKDVASGRPRVHEQNRILKLVDHTTPYVKHLRKLPLVKSVTACILMQQLDYWFNIQGGESFYKFLEPCPNQRAYKTGDSWTEELGFSADEFKTAFKQIGVCYESKGKYDAAEDKFQGKYYCSYRNRVTRETRYFRNHELIDGDLDRLFTVNGQSTDTDEDNSETVNANVLEFVQPGNSAVVEAGNHGPESTDTTANTTAEITPNITSRREGDLSNVSAFKKAEKEANKKEANKKQEGESNLTENPGDGGVINGIPVLDSSDYLPARTPTAGVFPSDFEITEEMRDWAEAEVENGNIADGIDLNHATAKFILFNEGKKSSNWINEWKIWMMNERPKVAIRTYQTASERRVEQYKRIARGDLFPDVTD